MAGWATCEGGACVGHCLLGTACGAQCVNLANDNKHCGSCDKVCAKGPCKKGKCEDDKEG